MVGEVCRMIEGVSTRLMCCAASKPPNWLQTMEAPASGHWMRMVIRLCIMIPLCIQLK